MIQLEDRVTPSNAPFQLSRPTGFNFLAATASDGQGNSVFVYNALNSDTWTNDVFAQLVDSSGNNVGDPILVNTPSDGDHFGPAVAETPDGRFVVTYCGDGPGADGACDIWAKEFNADGSAVGPEFSVGTYGDGYWDIAPTVAIDPDGNFVVASSQPSAQGPQQVYARFFSWDLQSSSGDVPLAASSSSTETLAARLSIATTGTLVFSYDVVDPTRDVREQSYIEPLSYALDGNGGFTVTAATPIALGATVQAVLPVAATDGRFVAVIDGLSADGLTKTIALEHFAADGTALDANPIPVTSAYESILWTEGAGMDGDGNLWVAWHQDDSSGDTTWNLMAEQFDPSGTVLVNPMRLTPDAIYEGADWPAISAVAVAPDGSLTVGWTTPDPTWENYLIVARHYDPIADSTTETDTLTPTSGYGTVTVVSQATTLGDSDLWEYWVTNNTSQSMGQFTISGEPEDVTDQSNDLGWTTNGTGVGWTASGSSQYLAAGATVYFTFTTPSAYAIQPTSASGGGGTFTATASGNTLGPGLTGPETDTLVAGTLGGQVSVVSSLGVAADGSLIWDYEVTNNSTSNIGEFAFLDQPVDASIPSFTSSLGWAVNEDDTGWAAGPDDMLLAPSQTADFYFTTPSGTAGHVAVRATSSDGTQAAEGNVLGPRDPPTATQTNTGTLSDGAGNSIAVTSTATTFSSYVLWQYSVTNNGSASLGQFSLGSQPSGIADEWNSLGWSPESTGTNWSAGTSGTLLGQGQTATFTFTTPSDEAPGSTSAQAGGGAWTSTASGNVTGPQPRVIDSETYTSMMTTPGGL